MNNVRETSLKCYDEIQEEGLYDSDMEMVYDAIKKNPLMTGREYAQIVLYYDDMNKIRPRISDLKSQGAIIELGKRKCSCSGRTAYIWATKEGTEKLALKRAGFIEQIPDLYECKEGKITCFQDFRKGKRRSYAFEGMGKNVNYKDLDCYKKFREELNKLLGEEIGN